ncbi:MAG TPA: undecaprenyldiphospho-muramoylpentapeptide beta-N-acetylglucosaminyltransferase [Bacteroidia bacterium]|nr:undecaprenyldiphospho-muramoylpentapeptide beta-N-acetylglucosaminyltransferase [Bacteroidia bacterium]HNT79885.1 undecaprenyldiphospho-muramoylpentapeptide beta-N-acetylglucosaminyltransferase [Bacteroidia bacterium]
MKPLRIIISGGGTGGHIFPALAIANALKEQKNNVELLFVGAEGKMEMEKVPAAGYSIVGLPIAGIQRSLTLKNFSFPFKLLKSLKKAKQVIQQFKPDAAIGVGGYASGPLLFMAGRKNIKYYIQEQNSYPGITNKWLANKAEKIFVAYDGMDRFFPSQKIIKTGNPVRKDIRDLIDKREEALEFFKLSNQQPVLLVVGGSQGALSINRAVQAGLKKICDQGVQLIWQTGKYFHPQAVAAVPKEIEQQVKVFDFVQRMDLAYAASNLVISRAGASTVSELSIVGKAAIMVPLPSAAEDHQTKNIEALITKDAALMVKDIEAKDHLIDTALKLIDDKNAIRKLENNIKSMALPDSAETIASYILKNI